MFFSFFVFFLHISKSLFAYSKVRAADFQVFFCWSEADFQVKFQSVNYWGIHYGVEIF